MEDFRLSRLSMIEVGFLTLLLEIPCSILDIQAHSRGGAEDAEPSISELVVTISSAATHPQSFLMAS